MPKRIFLFCLIALLSGVLFAQNGDTYIIADAKYNMSGRTREFALRQAVTIDYERIFPDRESLEKYIKDLGVRLSNERVFQESSVDYSIGDQNGDGHYQVHLVLTTVDTWNIIGFPYPKYDSNSGFEFKLKFKDYNFFGSMQELNLDGIFEFDENEDVNFTVNASFEIPFSAFNYAWDWNVDFGATFYSSGSTETSVSTGLEVKIPFVVSDIRVGLDHSFEGNKRDDDGVMYDDRFYMTDRLYANLPIVLKSYGSRGDLVFTPSTSISANYSPYGITDPDLMGPSVDWGYGISAGRVNWVGNFRKGASASFGNTWSYNLHDKDDISLTIDGKLTGHYPFFDRLGINSRAYAYYNFDGGTSNTPGKYMRGILNSRIDTDTALTVNVDIPLRVLRVDFVEVTGVAWTKMIGFEMHFSPFFDFTVGHDQSTDRMYSMDDAWYSGGLEIIVYPMRMRSIYGRISVGFDLYEVMKSGKLSGAASRDDASIRELFLGIGLHY